MFFLLNLIFFIMLFLFAIDLKKRVKNCSKILHSINYILSKDYQLTHTRHVLQSKSWNIHCRQDLAAEANKSPAEGRGAKPPPRSGSLVKSGRFSKWDFNSCRTSWTFSCLALYSCEQNSISSYRAVFFWHLRCSRIQEIPHNYYMTFWKSISSTLPLNHWLNCYSMLPPTHKPLGQ